MTANTSIDFQFARIDPVTSGVISQQFGGQITAGKQGDYG
jgi:hypothetical protein